MAQYDLKPTTTYQHNLLDEIQAMREKLEKLSQQAEQEQQAAIERGRAAIAPQILHPAVPITQPEPEPVDPLGVPSRALDHDTIMARINAAYPSVDQADTQRRALQIAIRAHEGKGIWSEDVDQAIVEIQAEARREADRKFLEAQAVARQTMTPLPVQSDAQRRAQLRSDRAAKAAKTRSLHKAEAKRAQREAEVRKSFPEWIVNRGSVTWDEQRKTSVIQWPYPETLLRPDGTPANVVTVSAPPAASDEQWPEVAGDELDIDLDDGTAVEAAAAAEAEAPDTSDPMDPGAIDPEEAQRGRDAEAADAAQAASAGQGTGQAIPPWLSVNNDSGISPEDILDAIAARGGLTPQDYDAIAKELLKRGAASGRITRQDLQEVAEKLADERNQAQAAAQAAVAEQEQKSKAEAQQQRAEQEAAQQPASVGHIDYDPEQLDRMRRAVLRVGPVFIFGPTATFKTSMPMALAKEFGATVDLLSMEPGFTSDNTYGMTVADGAGGWEWRDGPICTWARGCVNGEKRWLIIDELPRGPRTVVSEVMPILNLYTAQQILALGHPLPAHGNEPYHLVRVPLTHEVFIFSAELGKLWATANLGDAYEGLSLNDPAFRGRWVGGFIEIEPQSAEKLTKILTKYAGGKANVDKEVVSCIVKTHTGIQRLQDSDKCLVMTTNLRILLAWHREVMRVLTQGVLSVQDAILQAARDLWIDMVVEVDGDHVVAETKMKVENLIKANLPQVKLP